MKKYLDEVNLVHFVDLMFDLSGIQFSDDPLYVVCTKGNMIEMLASWYAGGGVHCHTNDQPSP